MFCWSCRMPLDTAGQCRSNFCSKRCGTIASTLTRGCGQYRWQHLFVTRGWPVRRSARRNGKGSRRSRRRVAGNRNSVVPTPPPKDPISGLENACDAWREPSEDGSLFTWRRLARHSAGGSAANIRAGRRVTELSWQRLDTLRRAR